MLQGLTDRMVSWHARAFCRAARRSLWPALSSRRTLPSFGALIRPALGRHWPLAPLAMGDILKSMAGTSGGASGWGSSPGGRPGPDGHQDDLLPEDLDGLTLHAPDDPRELEGDREQWLREEGEEQDTGSPGPPFIGVFGSATERRKARQRRLAVTAAIV